MEISIFVLRILMGFFMLAGGLEKVFWKGQWTDREFLANANGLFASWYHPLAGKKWVEMLNMWALTLAGVALVLGMFVKIVGALSAILMLLYYFGYKPKSIYLIFHETLMYAFFFLFLAAVGAGFFWGLDSYLIRYLPGWIF